ncbi:MAG: hypothetical protein KAS66_04065 [Candidatus Omnitrophica bacterium]|nr:hypothetical protein [Candidatus Omnitrophota bacterium]
MEYDFDKVMPTNPAVEFFEKHKFEVIAACMRIQPNTDGVSEEQADKVRFEAMDAIAKKHEYGKFRHLCKTCFKEIAICDGDPMFNENKGEDNVCYCEQYVGSIPPEFVAKGLSSM